MYNVQGSKQKLSWKDPIIHSFIKEEEKNHDLYSYPHGKLNHQRQQNISFTLRRSCMNSAGVLQSFL